MILPYADGSRYLCESYDAESRLIPREPRERAKVREWVAASEGTFMLHALSVSALFPWMYEPLLPCGLC
jgi:glutathione S-transferase